MGLQRYKDFLNLQTFLQKKSHFLYS